MSTISRLARFNTELGGPPSASTSAILGKLEALDNVLRLSLDKPQQGVARQAEVAPPASPAQARPQPDFATAFDLLNRASAAMDVLQNRCDDLENSAKVRADHFKMAIDVAHQQIKASEERASTFETKYNEAAALLANVDQRVEAAESRAQAAEARADAAERRIEAAEKRARAAEQSASDSSEWLKCYYERIISAFGMRRETEPFKQAV